MISPQTLLQNRYLVLEQIGQGGMGAVYKATDERFGSTVALKETFFEDPALRRAFEREARLLNHLRHHTLPRVSDYFSEGEGLFLVMEYIPGSDLAQMLKERAGAFPAREVLAWADQLLDALDYLHSQETPVVHRDIKPQNLKLTGRSQIVLLDFGLAKGPAFQATRATATGSVLGYSLNYAPLEQMQGVGTDPRSDLYSLGATLYHLLTGVTPPDAITRATAVLNGEADPLLPANEVHPQVPPSIAAVLRSAMALNAGQRPQSADAMRTALREAATRGADGGATVTSERGHAPSINEQDTQLLTRRASAPPNTVAGDAEGGTRSAAPGDSAVLADQPASVVTRVRATNVSPPAGRGRALGIGAGVLALVLAAVAVYSFTSGWHAGVADTQPTPQPTPQAAPEPTPAPAAVAAESPQSTPTPVAAVSVSKPTAAAGKSDRKAKRSDRGKAAAGAAPDDSEYDFSGLLEPPGGKAAEEAGPAPRSHGRLLSPEELEAARARRIAEETRRRIIRDMRRQQLEEQRLRMRRVPPPPAQAPLPRREPPPSL